MKKVLPAVAVLLLGLTLVSGCGDGGYGNSPGDQPSGTQSTTKGGGGGGY
jgi:hypothetical protein